MVISMFQNIQQYIYYYLLLIFFYYHYLIVIRVHNGLMVSVLFCQRIGQ